MINNADSFSKPSLIIFTKGADILAMTVCIYCIYIYIYIYICIHTYTHCKLIDNPKQILCSLLYLCVHGILSSRTSNFQITSPDLQPLSYDQPYNHSCLLQFSFLSAPCYLNLKYGIKAPPLRWSWQSF